MRSLRFGCGALAGVLIGTSAAVGATVARNDRVAALSTVICDVVDQIVEPPPVDLSSYAPVVPDRLIDTRQGLGGHEGLVPGGCALRFHVGLDDAATAAALSVTAVTDRRGFFTVYPCAAGRPETSSLNTRADSPTPALVIVPPDRDGDVCVFTRFDAHVVVDLQGSWSPVDGRADATNGFVPLTPTRAFDSRQLPGRVPRPAGAVQNIDLAGTIVPADATAVVANLTVTETAAPGWVSAYPCGEPPPPTSNNNYLAGETRAVAVVVGLGTRRGGEGQMCVETLAATHIIVDVVGYYAPVPAFGPTTRVVSATRRLADTRTATGPWVERFAAGETRELDPLIGHPDRPDATAVSLNAIGLAAESPGFLSFFPCGDTPDAPRPDVSSLNTEAGRAVANLLTVELSAAGTVCVYSHTSADVVVDLVAVATVDAGSPLRRLAIRRLDGTDRGADLDVWPPFDASIADYVTICPDAQNRFQVHARPHGERDVVVNDVVVDDRGVEVVVATDDVVEIVVDAGVDAARSVFRVRCLPADFPRLRVDRPGRPEPGWYLTALETGGGAAFLVLLDDWGVPVWYKRTGAGATNPKRLGDGRISFDISSGPYGFEAADAASIVGLSGEKYAEIQTDDPARYPLDHHALLEHVPTNGGAAWTTLSYPLVGGVDLSDLNAPMSDYPPRPPDAAPEVPPEAARFGVDEFVVDNSIREIDADGALVWEWTASEHFAVGESQFPVRFFQYRDEQAGGEVDLYHINSLAFVVDEAGAATRDYVASFRHLDAVALIDRSTGAVPWLLTSERTDGRDLPPNPSGAVRLRVVGDPVGGPRRPHDAKLIGDVLTLFDNRTETGQPARAVGYEIDANAGTATLLWQIDEPFGRSSRGLGTTQRAVDGSVLVGWGALQPMFEEFDPAGSLVLSIEQEPFNVAFRIRKYPIDAFDIDELRANAGGGVRPDVDG